MSVPSVIFCLNRKKEIAACIVPMEPCPALPFNKEIAVDQAPLKKPRSWGWLVLFASFSTLLCCALPIILVSLGMGAVVASLAANLPILIVLSQHKIWMFLATAGILGLAGWSLFRPGRSCPTDPELAERCKNVDKWNARFFWSAVVVWGIGFITAYLLPFIA